MARPRVIVREQYADVDWGEVRSLIIGELAKFGWEDQAVIYVKHMLDNSPRPGYQQAMKMAAASLLRVLKVHPASEMYSISGAYAQLAQVATIEGVEWPDKDFLRYLHRDMLGALVRGAGTDAGLPNDPFAHVGKASPPLTEAEAVTILEPGDAPYRRVRLTTD